LSELEEFAIDQAHRLLSVESTSLGARKLLLTSFEGTEELSGLPPLRLEIASRGRALKSGEILGQKLGVAIRAGGEVRKFNGLVSRVQSVRSTLRDQFLQIIELVPPAWVLTLNRRCRIFHDKKATDIVAQVLQEGGVSCQLKSAGAVREYCVQYGESDFQFVTRLLAEEGLFYRFGYEDPSCPMIIGNGAGDYTRLDPDTAEFERDLRRWQPEFNVGPSSYRHGDWDYKAVSVMEGTSNGLPKAQPQGLSAREFYEYPGSFATADEGEQLARARMEQHESAFICINGGGVLASLTAGAKFKVKGHSVDLPGASASATQYALLKVAHHVSDTTGSLFEGATSYTNDFVCIPADFNFRPPRNCTKPQIFGPQTATVTDGPDDMGRAKVKFHWFPDEQSRWVRVAQSWAYNQMGTQFLPRIDSEVVVEFLDGDPDQPLIVGMVFNGKNKLLYSLPDNKTQSGVRGANWGDAGAADQSNELRFEDLAGSEEIYLHAQKDRRTVVENDDSLTVNQGNRTIDIKTGNQTLTVDQGNRSVEIKTGNDSLTLDQGDRNVELKMGNLTETLSVGNHSTKLSAGNHQVQLSAGASSIDAMQSITFTVGANSLTIDQTGVTIKGMMVSIQGQIQLDLKGVMTTVNGDGMLTLKGAITMIN
jgi:type VI secretion system secreted protein VgrG